MKGVMPPKKRQRIDKRTDILHVKVKLGKNNKKTRNISKRSNDIAENNDGNKKIKTSVKPAAQQVVCNVRRNPMHSCRNKMSN